MKIIGVASALLGTIGAFTVGFWVTDNLAVGVFVIGALIAIVATAHSSIVLKG
jgi:hypothetical protein